MIEYPNCENDDCWYERNSDRLNEYKKSYKAVNNDGEICWYCDNCIYGIDYGARCNICDKYMLNEWIVLDDICVCARCVRTDDIINYICKEEQPEKKFKMKYLDDLREYPKFYHDKLIKYPSGKEIRFSEVLKDLIEKVEKDREKRKECKKSEIELRFDYNRNTISKIMKVSLDCAEEVAGILNVKVKVPNFEDYTVKVPNFEEFTDKRDRLLLWLVEQLLDKNGKKLSCDS